MKQVNNQLMDVNRTVSDLYLVTPLVYVALMGDAVMNNDRLEVSLPLREQPYNMGLRGRAFVPVAKIQGDRQC